MKTFKTLLAEKKIVLLDGGLGTELQRLGLEPGAGPEIWNIENRDSVYKVAKSYVDAGSDAITTNSFGATSIKLGMYGLGDRASEINIASAEIAREASGNKVMVMGCIGPTGRMLIMGDVSESELYENYADQATALMEGGVDVILLETMIDLAETLITIRAVKENTGLEIGCSFTYAKSPDGKFRTPMGATLEDVCKGISDAGVDVIGTNCGNGIEEVIEIVRLIKSAAPGIPILAQANAGIPVIVEDRIVYPSRPGDMASRIPELLDSGAVLIGGCCGTTPDHISEFARVLRN